MALQVDIVPRTYGEDAPPPLVQDGLQALANNFGKEKCLAALDYNLRVKLADGSIHRQPEEVILAASGAASDSDEPTKPQRAMNRFQPPKGCTKAELQSRRSMYGKTSQGARLRDLSLYNRHASVLVTAACSLQV